MVDEKIKNNVEDHLFPYGDASVRLKEIINDVTSARDDARRLNEKLANIDEKLLLYGLVHT